MTAVTMHLGEIGQQLRAFRLESGMRADEIAARLGVSRAALYRYEKGEVIKLDTVQRLAELLNISPLTLLGVGIEYYSCPNHFFQKITQIEGDIEQILQVSDPVCYQVTSPAYDAILLEAHACQQEKEGSAVIDAPPILAQSKRRALYSQRKPSIISMLPENHIIDFLTHGVGASFPMSAALRHKARQVAVQEIRNIITLIDSVPMGLQFSVVPKNISTTSCIFMRRSELMAVAINPFRSDCSAARTSGIAMITSSPEAVATHKQMLETLWQTSLKGQDAIDRLKTLVEQHGAV
ncbi:helix-turn-helix domain-containing protein [Acetobacter malorum]|uniref:helix-turn-helix domain-containing protein n=1 Tax=Acetobacter malorum TaxID=178901 RepID=UPI0039ED0795